MLLQKRDYVVYSYDRKKLLSTYELFWFYSFLFLGVGFLVFWVWPSLSFVLGCWFFMWYYSFYREVWGNSRRRAFYEKLLSPKMSLSHFVKVGYRVDEDELDRHLAYLNKLDSEKGREEALRYLKGRELAVRNGRFWDEVGLSKSNLTTHFWVIGTTGAGKTSFIMTLIQKVVENGGGCIFVDGKADEKMFAKLYNIAKASGRVEDVLLINFLGIEGEAKEHTNTFNPFVGAPPEQIVELLSSLLGEPSGDQAYWMGRGKAMLTPIVYFLCFREKYYKERWTISMLADFVNDANKYLLFCAVLLCLCEAWEKKIVEDAKLVTLLQKVKVAKGILHPVFPNMEALVYYYTLKPPERLELSIRGYDFEYLFDLWKAFQLAYDYVRSVRMDVAKVVQNISRAIKTGLDKEEGIIEMGWNEFIEAFQKGYEILRVGAESEESFRENFEFPKEQAIQQHAYAQQQWTQILTVLTSYSHIFDTLEPEVDLLDVIKNQKILYVLLPPLKQSAHTTQLLGRIILTGLRFAVAKALGGLVENMTKEQKKVLEDMITPRPIGLCIFDEYGSYPIEGIDTFLAQVRSINVSVVLSTQDYTSARVGGRDENSVKRAWANTQKLILRVKDNETLKAIEESLVKVRELNLSYYEVEGEGFIQQVGMNVGDVKPIFDVNKLTGFKNGLGLFLVDDEPVITQIYWVDCKPAEKVYLNHYLTLN